MADALPPRHKLIEVVALHTCTRNCYGVHGYAASCCKLENRNFIQGPVRDAEEFLAKLSERLGRAVAFDEVFVTFEEGSALFPDKPVWQDPRCYPAIRPTMNAELGYPCPFLTEGHVCGVYEIRPRICQDYKCDRLTTVLNLI
jgi:Fe-S-cluster containining protein